MNGKKKFMRLIRKENNSMEIFRILKAEQVDVYWYHGSTCEQTFKCVVSMKGNKIEIVNIDMLGSFKKDVSLVGQYVKENDYGYYDVIV